MGNFGENVGDKSVAERGKAHAFLGAALFAKFERFGKTNDAGHIEGAGAAAVFLSASVHLGCEFKSLTHIEQARSFGAVNFTAAQGEEIDAEAIYVEIEDAGGLACVRVHARLRRDLFDELNGLGHRLNGADFVVGKHEADESGVSGKGFFKGIESNQSASVHGQEGDVESVLVEILAAEEHRVVLDGAGEDVVPLLALPGGESGALDGRGVGLGTAGREDDLVR